MGQLLHILQRVDVAQRVVGTINGGQRAAIGPGGQCFDLVGREIEYLQIGQRAQRGDVADGVAGDAQIGQLGTGSQNGDICQIVVVHRQMGQQRQLVHAVEVGQLVEFYGYFTSIVWPVMALSMLMCCKIAKITMEAKNY